VHGFYPEDGGNKFLLKSDNHIPDYTAFALKTEASGSSETLVKHLPDYTASNLKMRYHASLKFFDHLSDCTASTLKMEAVVFSEQFLTSLNVGCTLAFRSCMNLVHS
jgi:hypothetical protein